ncbi:MAG: hypothetical protein V4633_05440 [Pseudomonadota bacterium]
MNNSVLSHDGYSGSAEISFEDDCLHGKILYISDLVTYEAETVAGLRLAFESAVDNYVEQCAVMGVMPEKPSPGTTTPESVSV